MRQLFSWPDWHLSLCGHLGFTLRTRGIRVAPAFMRGLRALFITDVHVVSRTTDGDLRAFMEKLSAVEPDILLLGGDYADDAENARRFFEALAVLRPPLGCFGVLGNNDREAWPEVGELREVMAAAGCRLLVNEAECVALPGGELVVSGIDEFKYGAPEMERALLPRREDRCRILLSHFPVVPEPMPELVLSGHTHGGQFNFLGLTPYTIGFELLFQRTVRLERFSGMASIGGGQLLVSKGIGASRIPVRAGVRPEIELLAFL